MSKRKATTTPAPYGVVDVMREYKAMEGAIKFIVDVDESNAKIWRVSLEPKILKTHGLDTLINQLRTWANTGTEAASDRL